MISYKKLTKTTQQVFAVGIICAASSSSTNAGVIESHWIAGAGGAFNNPANWDGPVPDDSVTAIFDLASTYTVTFDVNAFSDRVLLGDGEVTYDLSGFGYSVMNPVAVTPSVVVGDLAKGFAQLTITNGSLNAKFTNIGEVASSSGSLIVTDGSELINDFHLRVGHNGDGTFELSNGSLAESFVTSIGIQDTATGSATVTGVGTELIADSSLVVALEGIGNLLILDGATVTSGTAIIGEQILSDGNVTVSGTGSAWTIDGPFDVGQTGFGTLEILDGGYVSANSFVTVGTFPEPAQDPILGGVGEIIVDGAGSLMEIQGDLYVGFIADGRWTLSSGGQIAIAGDVFRGDWLKGDELPQTVIELSSSDDYLTPAITCVGIMESFDPRIDLIDGFVPSAGDVFEIVGAGIVLEFNFDLPVLPVPLFWELDQVFDSITLSVGPIIPGDLDGTGTVSTADLLILLSSWGPCGDCGNCPADLDGDCQVSTSDLLILLSNWG